MAMLLQILPSLVAESLTDHACARSCINIWPCLVCIRVGIFRIGGDHGKGFQIQDMRSNEVQLVCSRVCLIRKSRSGQLIGGLAGFSEYLTGQGKLQTGYTLEFDTLIRYCWFKVTISWNTSNDPTIHTVLLVAAFYFEPRSIRSFW